MLRREFLRRIGALTLLAQAWTLREVRAAGLPTEIAGVRLPHSALALGAADFARSSCPDFLFNHCMRTYLFGALALNRQKRAFRAEDAFVAAMFHDSGLLPAFESPKHSFEVDGADTAERWVRNNGGSKAEASRIWYAVEMHTGDPVLPSRQGPEAMLVYFGAGADVDGPELSGICRSQCIHIHCPLGRPRGLVHGAPVPAFGNGALVGSKVGEAGSIVCIHRLHGIMKNVASNRRSESLTIIGRRAEMDARKDSSILYFPECG